MTKKKNNISTFFCSITFWSYFIFFSNCHCQSIVKTGPDKTETIQLKKDDQIIATVDEEAHYPGGREALNTFLSKNLIYPEIALEDNISGRTYVELIIEQDGEISSLSLKKGMNGCPECDKESLRVLKMMPNWIPAKLNGNFVKSRFIIPVIFSIY